MNPRPPTLARRLQVVDLGREVPYRAALDHGLIYTRLGNPLGKAELAAGPPAPKTAPRIR